MSRVLFISCLRRRPGAQISRRLLILVDIVMPAKPWRRWPDYMPARRRTFQWWMASSINNPTPHQFIILSCSGAATLEKRTPFDSGAEGESLDNTRQLLAPSVNKNTGIRFCVFKFTCSIWGVAGPTSWCIPRHWPYTHRTGPAPH